MTSWLVRCLSLKLCIVFFLPDVHLNGWSVWFHTENWRRTKTLPAMTAVFACHRSCCHMWTFTPPPVNHWGFQIRVIFRMHPLQTARSQHSSPEKKDAKVTWAVLYEAGIISWNMYWRENQRRTTFTTVFGDWTSFQAKGLPRKLWNRNFASVFWRSNVISCERVAAEVVKSQFHLSFLAIERHFVRKGLPRKLWNRNFTSDFGDRTSFRAKRLPRTLWNRNFTSVLGDRTSFRAKGLPRKLWNRNFTSDFGDRTSFRAKRLLRKLWNRNFTSVFGDRTSFRAKGLRFVPSRWHCPAPSREK